MEDDNQDWKTINIDLQIKWNYNILLMNEITQLQ